MSHARLAVNKRERCVSASSNLPCALMPVQSQRASFLYVIVIIDANVFGVPIDQRSEATEGHRGVDPFSAFPRSMATSGVVRLRGASNLVLIGVCSQVREHVTCADTT